MTTSCDLIKISQILNIRIGLCDFSNLIGSFDVSEHSECLVDIGYFINDSRQLSSGPNKFNKLIVLTNHQF